MRELGPLPDAAQALPGSSGSSLGVLAPSAGRRRRTLDAVRGSDSFGGAGGPAFRAGWRHCEQNSGCEAREAQKKLGQRWGQIPSSLVTPDVSGSLCAPRTQASPEVASLGRRGRAGGAGAAQNPRGSPLLDLAAGAGAVRCTGAASMSYKVPL